MAPTEATILSTFLLPPAPLPSIISLKAFTELFPRSQQSSPQIRTLYRDLQHQRAQITDAVAHNIATETKRGNAQRRALVKARRAAAREEQDDEVDIESAVSTATLRNQGIFADSCP
jgi:centromere-localized protein 2